MSEEVIFENLRKEYQIPWNWTVCTYDATVSFPSKPSYVRFRLKVYECGIYAIYGRQVIKHLADWIAIVINDNEAFSIYPVPPLDQDFPYEYLSSDVSHYFHAGTNKVTLKLVKNTFWIYTHFFKLEVYIQSEVSPEVTIGTPPQMPTDMWTGMMQLIMGMFMFMPMMLMMRAMGEVMPRPKKREEKEKEEK